MNNNILKKIYISSLGCPKNFADSERLAGVLEKVGFKVVFTPEEADIGLVNTCGFLQAAVEEGIQAILELERLKQEKILKKIAVVGCMLNRYGEDLKAEFPTVDYWARSEEWEGLIKIMGHKNFSQKSSCARTLLSGTPWTRYLKISEGCNCHCSYCAIPNIRGKLKSRPIDEIIFEAQKLISEGAKELCLVGQELNDYGSDIYGKRSLLLLLKELEKELPENLWLRLFYLHPSHLDEKFLAYVANSNIILPWLDVPIQHIDNDILRRMNRPPVEKHIRDLFKIARDINPDFAFRTTLMVGFPGETRKQFDKLLDFVEDIGFDRLGAFMYSQEEGTEAATYTDQISEKEKNARYDELMKLQQSVSIARQAHFVGKKLDVLVDEINEDGYPVGRSFRDAPEIDGLIVVDSAKNNLDFSNVKPGDIIRVNITSFSEYDLSGELIK